ncbi:MAG: hypothetical protein ACYTAO_06290 [Planctomycetota bacterium]|jgi:hypothetical protein
MSIRRRVEDAVALHKLGRFDGALLSALVAAASTARTEIPDRNVSDRECFEKFLAKSAAGQRIKVEFRGELHSIPHIFYKWLRCELVHEGSIPLDIEFVAEPSSGQLSFRAGGAPHYVLQLSRGWLSEILRLVKTFTTNRGEFEQSPG